ncbi:hypothetical protein [Pseudomonas fluorescens]|uniref:Uncharacterized protein n=1 Tax=Pseudomonas fluorescens TaxID=294 RepID=A0A423MCI8_PSEFL|nr:hypothetical protein [Pseudomonas fluorescens]RON81001.1 hypothetical protein BK670_12500 [Pseudomonas fluorescens]
MRITVSKTLIAAMEAAANARAEKDEAFEELPDSETIRNDPGRYLNARVAHQKAKSTYDEKVRDLGVIVLQTSKPAFDNAEAIHAIRHEMLEVFNETSKGAINKRKLFVYGFIRAMYTASLCGCQKKWHAFEKPKGLQMRHASCLIQKASIPRSSLIPMRHY